MGRRPRIPLELKRRPFTLEEARAAGISRHQLSGKTWRRLGKAIYSWREWRKDPLQLLSAWQRQLPGEAVFAGATAAWLWSLDIKPDDPIEVVVPVTSGIRSRHGLTVRHQAVARDEVSMVRGLLATTPSRTLRDLCLRLPFVEALVVCDMALRAGLRDAFNHLSTSRLRELAALAAPAESPMETRLRWLLLEAGLPRPLVQTELRDSDGRFVARADLYFPSAGLVIEYDGVNHRDRLVADDRRQNLLVNAGFRLLRFTSQDLERPETVVSQVRRALRQGPL